jgi:serine/threonine protein kinase
MLTNGLAGTVTHLPPEAFDGHYSFKNDVWALGVILFELANLELPFSGKAVTEIIRNIIRFFVPLIFK